ncbi:MAG: SpaA isopeptide-forming pilin-related protein, partial [Varibaculum cambriense]|nr:SpaA isopeptide-forming pilin-related protein [Varibaculum cambriense]
IKNLKLPTKAEIRWEVVSTADSSQYVPGTSFKVTALKADGQTLDTAKSFTVSDATAIAGNRDLNPNLGQYRVEVPDGSLKYQVEQLGFGADFAPKTGAQVVTFKLQKDERYSQIVVGNGLKFENTPVMRTAQFTWKLVDKDSKKPLSGGSFSLKDGSETVPVTENKADASFQATLNQAKTYKLQQTAAPEGYEKDTKTYTISYEDGKAQVSVDDTGVDLTDGALVISNSKKATKPSGELTWKVVDSEGKAVAGTSFQVTPLGKDGKPTAAAFEVTDFASGPTTFGVPTDLDAATGAYRVKVSDVTLQYQLEQLTTAEGLQLAAAQTLSFSKGTDGKWSQNAASSLVNPVAPEEPPTTDPTNEPSTPST